MIVSKTGNNIRIEIQNQISNSIDGLDRDIDAKNYEINSFTFFAIAFAKSGGTALPICLN